VRNSAQQPADYDETEAAEWASYTGELLARHADRFPALIKATAEGAFDDEETDQLEFGLDRLLDGVDALIEQKR